MEALLEETVLVKLGVKERGGEITFPTKNLDKFFELLK